MKKSAEQSHYALVCKAQRWQGFLQLNSSGALKQSHLHAPWLPWQSWDSVWRLSGAVDTGSEIYPHVSSHKLVPLSGLDNW